MHSSNIDYRETTCSEDEFTILETLLSKPDQFVSGNYMAERLGITRPAVWKKLVKLREQGFTIDAVSNRGYRLVQEPEILHLGLLRYYLKAVAIPMDTLCFPVIDSTNSEAERQFTYGRKSPFAVAASAQTKGRGRLGREWHSTSAENLYLSVLFEPTLSAARLQNFTLWAGIYICRELQEYIPNASLKIKWPNDLYCDGRKFAGMLTEAKMDADTLRSIIFGIGINVNSNPNSFPKELRSTATSLYAIHGEKIPLNQLTAKVLQATHRAYQACTSGQAHESLTEAWSPLNALADKHVTVCQNGQETSGVVSGIETTGALQLRQSNGNILSIRAGEVTLRKP
ncbi:MAG: BirA family biotin operon repressor/biotin-[acetyl-CoA-carboxylase] ligase [Lentimonas sp.]|jgi:BirA family biotin operon repressor/biotin-[acetyl-CoA-carboxylase] ligase